MDLQEPKKSFHYRVADVFKASRRADFPFDCHRAAANTRKSIQYLCSYDSCTRLHSASRKLTVTEGSRQLSEVAFFVFVCQTGEAHFRRVECACSSFFGGNQHVRACSEVASSETMWLRWTDSVKGENCSEKKGF